MTAPVASGWSGCRVGLAPNGKRRLFTAHTRGRHFTLRVFVGDLIGSFPSVDSHRRLIAQIKGGMVRELVSTNRWMGWPNAICMTDSMSLFPKVRLFFRVSIRFLFRTSSQHLSQILSKVSAFENIELTDGLYLRVPKAEVTLTSVVAGSEFIQSMTLSVDEATQIFRSIKRACDLHDVVKIKVGELSWTTDARLRSNPDKVIIVFNGPLGYMRTDARREDVAAAITEFTNRFGLR